MSFILKLTLYKAVCFFKHKNKPLLLYEFCILLSTELDNPLTIKNAVFTSNSENSSFFEILLPEGLYPPTPQALKIKFRPSPSQKCQLRHCICNVIHVYYICALKCTITALKTFCHSKKLAYFSIKWFEPTNSSSLISEL